MSERVCVTRGNQVEMVENQCRTKKEGGTTGREERYPLLARARACARLTQRSAAPRGVEPRAAPRSAFIGRLPGSRLHLRF